MSNGINVNPLNDITKVYLNQIATAKAKETEKDIERWTQAEETECNESPKGKDCDVHGMKECPDPVQEEKKAKKDYDGDGKVESGSKEHAGVVHNAIQKKKGGKADGQDTRKEGYQRNPEGSIKDRFKSKQTDPSKKGFTGIGDSIEDIMKQNAAMKKAEEKKKMKKESTLQDLTKVYLNQVAEHHQKDENGNTIPHEDELDEAERSLSDRLARKRKVYDKTTKKAMQFARDEGEASGHARYRMSSISREMDGIRAKMNKKKTNEGRTYTWRDDINLREVMTDDGEQKEVTEKKVKNKIKINPKLGEAIEEIGGEVLEAYTVTNADKKGNTPAYQAYKAGKKNVKTGKPMYKAADHMKEEDDINEKISASGYARAKKYREDQAREKDRKEQEYFAKKAKTHKWDGEKWNKRESVKEGYGKGVKMADLPKGSKVGSKKVDMPKGSKKKHNCASKVKHEEYGMGDCIKEMHTLTEDGEVTHYDIKFSNRIIRNVPVDSLEVIEEMHHEHYVNDEKNVEVFGEEDKKGSGSGTKDACYKKVKASAKVWPSAYASGRLVQCRKKGASNYGKSKSESYSWRDDFIFEDEDQKKNLTERPLSQDEEGDKERIVKGMKKDTKGFKNRYGDDYKSVMYATATKLAKEETETIGGVTVMQDYDETIQFREYETVDIITPEPMKGVRTEEMEPKKEPTSNMDDKKSAEASKKVDQKQKRVAMMKKIVLQKKLQAVRSGAGGDIVAGYEPEGELVETSAVLDANKELAGKPKPKRSLGKKVRRAVLLNMIKRGKDKATIKRVMQGEEVESLQEYSPNVTYQAKGGKKSGKLGKSSVYSLKDKGESKKDFRKSQIKDIKGGYLKTEGSLHKWFKGSKSKDGKGGWVNVVTGGTCASDEPGEGTPKCVSSSKRASMTKAERDSASRRKKAADPGQQSKSGAAKPTYVATDKKKKVKVDEACWKGYKAYGMKKKGGKMVPNCKPVGSVKKEGASYGLYKGDGKVKIDGYEKMKAKIGSKKKHDKPAIEEAKVDEAAAWTKKAGKNKSGGLNEKGRKSYEAENPGSDLKAPSKKVGNPRRASFCARMKGMKSKLTSAKTARDPDSRINKSLRKWNCEYEPQGNLIGEEGYDRMRDDRLVKYGIGHDGSDRKSKTNYIRKPDTPEQKKRRQAASDRAYSSVVDSLKKKYGDGVMTRSKKTRGGKEVK